MRLQRIAGAAVIWAAVVHGQTTQVDLRTQARSVDFSNAASTKPSKTGLVLPATCSVGETFFKTDAAAGRNLYGCTTTNVWTPQSQAAPANYETTFVSATEILIGAADHGIEAGAILVDCYDEAVPARQVEPDEIRMDPTTRDVTITFSIAQSGRCMLSGARGTSTAAGEVPVVSVFGRTGAIQPASGDYTFAQISGQANNAQIAAGIDASKIGSGTVDNATLAGLAGLTGNVQAQLNGKANSAHDHVFTGDVAATGASLKVTGIQGRTVSTIAPAAGQTLLWNAARNEWAPASAVGSGRMADLDVAWTDSKVLTVGSSCTTSTPCNVRFGNQVYSITRSATVTISGGSGTVYLYIARNGVLTAGHNLVLACGSGCVCQQGITAFPADAIPLYTWMAAEGSWDATGGADRRAFLSTKAVSGGTGVIVTEANGTTNVAVDTATVPTYLKGSAFLNFPNIAAARCSEDLTFKVAGAVAEDTVAAGWPANLEAGLTGTMRVSVAGMVAVRICNLSGADIRPRGAVFSATVIRRF